MANCSVRRSQLFELYAANLALFTDRFPGLFVCPICEVVFPPEAVLAPHPAIDLAHIYPEATGATLATLTCSRCNNRMGVTYDHHLVTEHRVGEAMMGGDPIPGRISFEGGSVGVEFAQNAGRWHFNVVKAQTDPKQEAAMIAGLMRGPGLGFQVHFRYCHPVRQKIALLHAAYLALFRDFGYEFVLGARTQWIRDILTADPPPDDLPPFLTFHAPAQMQAWENPFDDRLIFKSGVAEVDGLHRCLIAVFPAADDRHVTRCVLLPGLGDEGEATYRELTARPEGVMRVRANVSAFRPYPRLADPKGKTYLRRLWRAAI